MMKHPMLLGAFLALRFAASCAATPSAQNPIDLSLEDLLNVEVMTASRKSQHLQDVAAAIFIITRDDIERSGVASLPEALRMAPGVNVARLANSRWAVSVRGFNGRFANKLLVLMDGRSLYSPLFSGVIWENEDTLLEDIDRIEIVRGPTAALWGSNAVNGVINIITRRARDTQGTQATLGGGSEERVFASLRHGVESSAGHFRLWGKGFARDAATYPDGQRGDDASQGGRIGWRGDWSFAPGHKTTLSGDLYDGFQNDRWHEPDIAQANGQRMRTLKQRGHGGHLLVRHELSHDIGTGAESALQLYLTHSDTRLPEAVHERRTTVDLDFQTRAPLAKHHDLIWGVGLRRSSDDIESEGTFLYSPQRQTYHLISLMVNDDIALIPDRLNLMVGARIEHHPLTGLASQPHARVMWLPSSTQAVWASLSRGVRTLSRSEVDLQLNLSVSPATATLPLPQLLQFQPGRTSLFSAEKATALEFGYRHQFNSQFLVDVTAFVTRYRDLGSGYLGSPSLTPLPSPTHILQPVILSSTLETRTHGLEASLDFHPLDAWRIQTSYSLLSMKSTALTADPYNQSGAHSNDATAPKNQLSVRSSHTLGERRYFDLWLRHTGALDIGDDLGNRIPAYTTLDLRYAWRPQPKLELAVVGQNLLSRRHSEFIPDLVRSDTTQVDRGLYFKAKWQF
ncbi:MAG TPA: TonB-dependent receptor [Rhodocyclaceae bacterium]|nr:TonB-dependent receptor [Rhodocyclaceae bacterium]